MFVDNISMGDIAMSRAIDNEEILRDLIKRVGFLEEEIFNIKYGNIKTLEDFVNRMGKDYVIDINSNLIDFDFLNVLLSKIFTHTRSLAPIVIGRYKLHLVYRERWNYNLGWVTIDENKNPYVESIMLGEILEDSKVLPKRYN